MLLLPGGSRFVIITHLQLTHATNRRPPRQLADDFPLACKRIEVHAMLCRPAILRRGREHGALVSNIRVLERELPDAEVGKPVDVSPHPWFAVDVATAHDAGGANGQAAGRVEKLAE